MRQVVAELKRQSKRLGNIVSELSSSGVDENSHRSLILRNNKGHMEFVCHDKTTGVFEYLGKDKEHTLAVLTRKRYGGKISKLASCFKKTIDECIGKLDGMDLKGGFSRLLEGVPSELVKYIEPWDDDELNARKWQERRISKSRMRNDSDFYTGKGEHVRSKSEVIIADRLKDNGVPYHYEPVFMVDENEWFYPDFLVLNKHTRQEFLWEHFGRMDDDEYRSNALSKIEMYAFNGYIPGRNLIVTFEGLHHQFNTKYVDILIETFLK